MGQQPQFAEESDEYDSESETDSEEETDYEEDGSSGDEYSGYSDDLDDLPLS